MTERRPLVLVSNRGPVTYQDDGSIKRGTGGLVTALTGLASHRDAVWIASAMTERDVEVTREHGGRPFEVEAPEGGTFRVRFVESDDDAYDSFYNIIANPMLWFIQHYLWDQSNAPDIRRHEVEAFEHGYKVVNDDLAQAVLEEIADQENPVVMVHDYHFYTLPEVVRREKPDVFLHHFIHIPWTQPDAWRVLPTKMRTEIYRGLLANDIVGFHTRSYRRNFLQCCRDLLDDVEVDMEAGVVRSENGHETWIRAYPLPIDYEATRALGKRDRVKELEQEVLRRQREHSILRVDRADLSKNILRGFTAFDIFLEQHPEFVEKVTFTAQLMPSRQDVPEYAEYLERIEALVAVVNHRHGTPDWMPINLKLRDDLDEAVASYKHYDVMMVNAMFDGMNLVAKEGPLVNERDGVSILSENTGAHEELGEFALSVNPFDVQELADALYAALTMAPEERARRGRGAQEDRHDARSGRLDRRPDRGHLQEGPPGPNRLSGELLGLSPSYPPLDSGPNSRSTGSGSAGAGEPCTAGAGGASQRERAAHRAERHGSGRERTAPPPPSPARRTSPHHPAHPLPRRGRSPCRTPTPHRPVPRPHDPRRPPSRHRSDPRHGRHHRHRLPPRHHGRVRRQRRPRHHQRDERHRAERPPHVPPAHALPQATVHATRSRARRAFAPAPRRC